ncbi:MAG: ABC transporter ATP-binding protein, partial [Bacteriovoracaceae bacterium]
MENSLVEIIDLSKSYGKTLALNRVSFRVPEGKVFALLGPNGAGKSTIVKCLLGLVKPTEGDILISGVHADDPLSRKNVSYLPEKFSFYPFYKVQNVLSFVASLKGVSKEKQKEQILDVASLLNIEDLLSKKVQTLSKGQLQRVGIASSFIGDNKLIILDEPFSGLDPVGIVELKEAIINKKNQGTTIFINSHLLNEMEKITEEC